MTITVIAVVIIVIYCYNGSDDIYDYCCYIICCWYYCFLLILRFRTTKGVAIAIMNIVAAVVMVKSDLSSIV